MNPETIDRHWLLTTTTYGTWLPGDSRGFVSNVADGPGPEVRHNIPRTPYDKNMPGLVRISRAALKSPPIFFVLKQAVIAGIEYVKNQDNPLIIWVNPIFCTEAIDPGEPGGPTFGSVPAPGF
jgi:hypothetical protein